MNHFLVDLFFIIAFLCNLQ